MDGKGLTIHYALRRRRCANRLVEGRNLGRPASALDADDFQAVAKHNVADAFDDQHPAIRTCRSDVDGRFDTLDYEAGDRPFVKRIGIGPVIDVGELTITKDALGSNAGGVPFGDENAEVMDDVFGLEADCTEPVRFDLEIRS